MLSFQHALSWNPLNSTISGCRPGRRSQGGYAGVGIKPAPEIIDPGAGMTVRFRDDYYCKIIEFGLGMGMSLPGPQLSPHV